MAGGAGVLASRDCNERIPLVPSSSAASPRQSGVRGGFDFPRISINLAS